MAYKITGITSSTGTATQFGAVDIDKYSQLLSGVDLTATDPVDVATQWRFRDNKMAIRDPANVQSVTFRGTNGMGADRTITIPALSANDTFVALNQTQTLTNKTISPTSNTITGIVDANIGAHTTTKITISSKSLLPNTLLYNDQDNALGAHYYDITQIAAPGSPAAGTRRFYCDSGNSSHFTIKKSDGTTLDVEAAVGGAGDMFLATAQTVTGAKTFQDNTFRLRNPADTFSLTLSAGAQTSTRTFTFPVTTSDTIVTAASSQTLTNKTLTSPTISTIINTGTLTLPTSSDTLVGRDTTDTMHNKTYSIDLNTFKHSTINSAGDIIKNDGTQYSRLARGTANQLLAVNGAGTDIAWTTIAGVSTREDLEAAWSDVVSLSVGTSYVNMVQVYQNDASNGLATLDAATRSIDFTGKTQFRAQFHIRRNTATIETGTPSNTPSVRVVDSTNSANVLFEITSISADTIQSVVLTSLPGWCSGVKTIVPQSKTNTGTASVQVLDMMVLLK